MPGINNPPTSPLTRANQFQKDFFPFEAFSADDPNLTENPTLFLSDAWRFVAFSLRRREYQKPISIVTAAPSVVLVLADVLYDTYILSGECGDDGTLTLYPPDSDGYGVKTFRIINRLVSNDATPHTLTVTTGVASMNEVELPIVAAGGDHSASSVTVDADGNVW